MEVGTSIFIFPDFLRDKLFFNRKLLFKNAKIIQKIEKLNGSNKITELLTFSHFYNTLI